MLCFQREKKMTRTQITYKPIFPCSSVVSAQAYALRVYMCYSSLTLQLDMFWSSSGFTQNRDYLSDTEPSPEQGAGPRKTIQLDLHFKDFRTHLCLVLIRRLALTPPSKPFISNALVVMTTVGRVCG